MDDDVRQILEPRVLLARVTADPLSVAACSALVHEATAGAVVTFEGVVRDHDDGRGVAALEYEAHPSASDVLAGVAADIARAHPEVAIAVEHRTGPLGIGDVALAAAVSSAHRAEAFAACALLIDEIKARVPIWKKQDFTDGTSEWVASLG
ncbi:MULTISPECIES: molybdenum cofactor biosynthesis protein MoaE [unclassified Frondihabitans]|uniref:molybdenum cofactor biosynthesis protein MoaE n=1 Tax=unclassified Frondihabitans TaxID=2626248 RepID=UPI000F50D99B|nr:MULTISPECIES: molybdenum cofactor biosynthesis protein MoaE [unclassified Frondihabitans]RPE76200.1 molybdopterin synthase subunit MoaE [Frondihabitans sp. PhB153]RPF05524.1 molybdopterin synthase subunit MoaE [Frondihabitans sp. PhB161]